MKPRGRHVPWQIKQRSYKEKIDTLDGRFKQALVIFQATIHAIIGRTKEEYTKQICKAALDDKMYRSDALIKKMIKDKAITGECSLCSINCYGTEAMPRKMSFPCGIPKCPFEKHRPPIDQEDAFKTLKQVKKDFLYD